MANNRTLLLVITLLFCLASSIIAQSPKVIVIGFDGLSGWGLSQTSTPVFNKMKQEGAHTLKAKAVLPTVSSPNWASMIMGAGPDQHGIKSNKWKRSRLVGKTHCNRTKGKIFPTIFGLLREQKQDSKIYLVHHWGDFARLTDLDAINSISNPSNEYKTVAKATEYIKDFKPDLLFIHFDHCDHAGHEFGHGTPQYFESIKVADSLTGLIIQATIEAGTFNETYFLVTADHGGIGKGHGGSTAKEVEIPWIITGPEIATGKKLEDNSINQYDTASTIAYILGLTPPDCWIGKPVFSAFKSK